MSNNQLKEALESGKKIPFQTMASDGSMLFYDLEKNTKLELTYIDHSTKEMTALEYAVNYRKLPTKPSEMIFKIKVVH